MQKNNLYFGLFGLALGVAIGYFATASINKNPPVTNASAAAANAQAPSGGPPPQVMELLNKARNEPDNFELQVQAAEMYFQIGRYDDSVKFLNQALKLKPNDEVVLINLTNVLLEKGDKAEAQKTFEQLDKLKASESQLKQRREELRQRLKAS